MSPRSILGSPACLLAALAAAVPTSAVAQATLRAGSEFRVNENVNGDQRAPSAVVAPDGTFFVVWESQFQDGDSFGILGRRFSAAGVPLGPEFQINQATVSDQRQPSITVDLLGRFTVVWAGQDASGSGVFARQYSATGPLGNEFAVNTVTAGEQQLPRVSAGPGGLAVVWQGQDGDGAGVFGRVFTLAGAPVTGEFQLSTTVARGQTTPVVAALDTGRYGVAWFNEPSSGTIPTTYSRLFDAAGLPLTPEQALTGAPGSIAGRNHVTIRSAAAGGFIVGWWEATFISGKFGFLSFDHGLAMRAHDANGTPAPLGATVGGAGQGTIAHWEGSLGVTLAGRLMFAYTSTPGVLTCFPIPPQPGACATAPEDGSGSGIFALPFGAAGLPARAQVNTFTGGDQTRSTLALDRFGNSLIAWQSTGQDGSGLGVYAQRFGGFYPGALVVDPAGNGVIDPGAVEEVRPAWLNLNGVAQTFGGSIYEFSGPAGATYGVSDGTASYGTVPHGATQACSSDCYRVSVSIPGARPATHLDAGLGEVLTPPTLSVYRADAMHVGGSFGDVPAGSPYYRFIETLLHNGVTSGCGAGTYCPGLATSREQMSVFVLVARQGRFYVPPSCGTPMFNDVPASSPYCRWIEELARRGVVGGCGGGSFCPGGAVSREQMSVFVLRTLDPALNPPDCGTPVFSDVPAGSAFCRWIEELVRRGVVAGCGGGLFCPTAAVTREQMAVFLSVTFGLLLY
jgi:hypothetical protein